MLNHHATLSNIMNNLKSRDLITLRCDECKETFLRAKNHIQKSLKKGQMAFYCSSKCSLNSRIKTNVHTNCCVCNKEIVRQAAQAKKSHQHCCSKTCASHFALSSRNIKPLSNCSCGKKLNKRFTLQCQSCRNKQIASKKDNLTLQDVLYSSGPSSIEAKWAKVRGRARTKYKVELNSGCDNCLYNKHVQVSHRKSISSFPLTTTVAEVNTRSNIFILCPNCHWEFDHQMLTADDIISSKAYVSKYGGPSEI